MIAYFDTSALVPLLVDESSSPLCRSLVDASDRLVTNQVTYVEATAAITRAERMGRVGTKEAISALEMLDDYWLDFRLVEVDSALISQAALLARRFALRGYDAIHCASAAQVADDDLVACAGDRALQVAWQGLGITARDTSSGAT